MEKRLDQCLSVHPMLHLVLGMGIGMFLIVAVPSLAENTLLYGLALILSAVVGEIAVMGYSKRVNKKRR